MRRTHAPLYAPLRPVPPPRRPTVNFLELWIFNPDGQLLSINGTAGVTVSNVIATGFNSSLLGAGDLSAGISNGFGQNPYYAWGGSPLSMGYHSGQCLINASYTVRFPAQPVSQAMMVRGAQGGGGSRSSTTARAHGCAAGCASR